MVCTDGHFRCKKCGHTEEPSEEIKFCTKLVNKDIVIIDEPDQIRTLPTVSAKCPECGNDIAEWWLRQLRSADESETRFYRCIACKYTWREYD
jgi:DNA-directed RNA polymerase subunit M